MMGTAEHGVQPQEFFLKPGYLLAHHEAMLVRCVLGTCVAVTMFDRHQGFGGMNHFLWPRLEDEGGSSTVMYGNVAIPALCRLLVDMGAGREALEAQIFGGATSREAMGRSGPRLGEDNLQMARRVLAHLEIPVVSEDVGGCRGRKVIYNTASNEVAVVKVDRLRATDWLDYGQDVDWERA